MKLSTFLFLLYFTLSTSVHFEIKTDPGIHVWNVHENLYPHYIKINRQYVSISESSSSRSVQQNTSILETGNTYIILNINEKREYSLYYWVGAESSMKKRRNVAVSVAFILKNQILGQTPENLKVFKREAEGAESFSFIRLFKLRDVKTKSRLYRVAGSEGQFIMEVPPTYSELNGSDSFVLDTLHKVYQLDSINSNECKIQQAKLFRNRILRVNEAVLRHKPDFHWINDRNPNSRRNLRYLSDKTEFLENITGVPEPWEFPHEPANYSDLEIANGRREKLTLYEYSQSKNVIGEQPVPWTLLTFNMIKDDNAYVLQDSLYGNIIVYLGNNASTKQISKSLSKAEELSESIRVNDAWQRIKVLHQCPRFPIWFELYFQVET